MEFLQAMLRDSNSSQDQNTMVLDEEIQDAKEWEDDLAKKQVIPMTNWDKYIGSVTTSYSNVEEQYKKKIYSVKSDWWACMPEDNYVLNYGTQDDKDRLRALIHGKYQGSPPYQRETLLFGKTVDVTPLVKCTVQANTVTSIGPLRFPYTEVCVIAHQGLTHLVAYRDGFWQASLILNTTQVPLGWTRCGVEGTNIFLDGHMISLVARGFVDASYFEVDVHPIKNELVSGCFLERTTLIPHLIVMTDTEGMTFMEDDKVHLCMPVAATAVFFRGRRVCYRQYHDDKNLSKVDKTRFAGVVGTGGQDQWAKDLIKLAPFVPIYAKDPSLEARALTIIQDGPKASKEMRASIKAVELDSYIGRILTPHLTFYHLSCAKYDLLKKYYASPAPTGIGSGHDPLTEITVFAYHAWINSFKVVSQTNAARRGVHLLVRSRAPMILPTMNSIPNLIPTSSVGRSYEVTESESQLAAASDELQKIKKCVQARSIESLHLWPKPFIVPVVDTCEEVRQDCEIIRPLIVSAMLLSQAFPGQGPPGTITFVAPGFPIVIPKEGSLYVRTKHLSVGYECIFILPDGRHPVYMEMYTHMFTHACSIR
jgi:hypothetical protein